MARRARPFGVLELDDYPSFAVVRYDGDPDVFTALAWAYLITEPAGDYCPPGIDPPDPRLFRCNPDSSGEYAWLLTECEQRGRGVFLGSRITIAGQPDGIPGRDWIVPDLPIARPRPTVTVHLPAEDVTR